jgi:hypothetical protein
MIEIHIFIVILSQYSAFSKGKYFQIISLIKLKIIFLVNNDDKIYKFI